MSLALALLGVGCAHRVATPLEPTSSDATALTPAATTWALQGFGATWQTRPHRISRVRFGVLGRPETAGQDLTAEIRGGSWASGERSTDVADLSVRLGGFPSPPDAARVQRMAVTFEALGPEPATQSLTQPWLGSADDGVVAWLDAFDFDTTASHPDGATVNTLGVWLGEPVVADGQLSLDVTAHFRPGPVPDRRQGLAKLSARARIGVVLVADPRARVHRVEVSAQSRADSAVQPVELALAPGAGSVLVGLSGFEIGITQDGPLAGRYLRSLGVALSDQRMDPVAGRMTVDARWTFSNRGPAPRPVKITGRVAVSALEWSDVQPLRHTHWRPDATQHATHAL